MLRSSREALLTVVGVVLHDPLYKWAMTPIKARRRQQALDEDGAGQGAVEVSKNAVWGMSLCISLHTMQCLLRVEIVHNSNK